MKATIVKLAETARFKAMMAYSFIIALLCVFHIPLDSYESSVQHMRSRKPI